MHETIHQVAVDHITIRLLFYSPISRDGGSFFKAKTRWSEKKTKKAVFYRIIMGHTYIKQSCRVHNDGNKMKKAKL